MRDALPMGNCYLRIESGRDIIPPSPTPEAKVSFRSNIVLKYHLKIITIM